MKFLKYAYEAYVFYVNSTLALASCPAADLPPEVSVQFLFWLCYRLDTNRGDEGPHTPPPPVGRILQTVGYSSWFAKYGNVLSSPNPDVTISAGNLKQAISTTCERRHRESVDSAIFRETKSLEI